MRDYNSIKEIKEAALKQVDAKNLSFFNYVLRLRKKKLNINLFGGLATTVPLTIGGLTYFLMTSHPVGRLGLVASGLGALLGLVCLGEYSTECSELGTGILGEEGISYSSIFEYVEWDTLRRSPNIEELYKKERGKEFDQGFKKILEKKIKNMKK